MPERLWPYKHDKMLMTADSAGMALYGLMVFGIALVGLVVWRR
jgi:hypothetical protein